MELYPCNTDTPPTMKSNKFIIIYHKYFFFSFFILRFFYRKMKTISKLGWSL